jgi:hypothetical protein
MWTANKVKERIDEDQADICNRLTIHPQAGAKFRSLSPKKQAAWIAWTWFYQRLVANGSDHNTAISIRSWCMQNQHRAGTYGIIASCLNRTEEAAVMMHEEGWDD